MSKGLEALKIGIPKLKKLYENNAKKMSKNDILGFDFTFVYLDKALQRLESIENAKPSEAIKYVDTILEYFGNAKVETMTLSKCNILDIKQALIKSQEQEKVLSILKEKRVDLSYLRCCIEDNQSVERYNEYIRNKTMDYDHEEELTQEEFELLKEVLNEINNFEQHKDRKS